MKRTLALPTLLAFAVIGCGAMPTTPCDTTPTTPDDTSSVTDQMREACPLLTDEVLEAFVLAVASLRDDGLSEVDALVQWVEGCESIPPDGNFQGDQEACATCLTVIVEDVYSAGL